MARVKEFDREQALEKALHLFWRRGYEATSLSDLLETMGIARQSLYDTFGDKHALFLEALERYCVQRDRDMVTALASASTAREGFDRLLFAIVEESVADKKRGCFGVSSAMELAERDETVARFIARRTKSTERIFFDVLERARERGEIKKSKDTRALSRFLLSVMQGLRVSAKSDPTASNLSDVATIALQSLD